MNVQTRNAQFLGFIRSLQPASRPQVQAVAEAIGCPEWTEPAGCERTDECFCAQAAQRVAELERAAVAA